MAQATLDGPQETTDLDVCGWDLDLNDLAILFLGGEVLAVLVVDVGGNVLSQAVSVFAELFVAAVDLIWVAAVSTLASVHLEVVQCPALRVVYWTRERLDWILHESNRPPLLRRDRLGLNNCGHGVSSK